MKHKQTLRRGLGVLFGLVLCLTLLTVSALAAEPATETADFTEYGNHTEALALLNAAKTGEAESTWDSDTKTLTLNGVDFSTSVATAVQLPENAKIVLAAGTENTITSTIASTDRYVYQSRGISVEGDLTIEGSGQLTATGGEADYSYGIFAFGDVTIESGTVKATGGTAQTESCGIYVTAGYDADADNWVVGNLTISGGTVKATGGTATGESGENFGIYVSGDVTISGGTVTATGGAAAYSCGIYAVGDVTISGGTVTATGGAATGEDAESYGIYAGGGAAISGGTVKATGGEAGSSYGIYAGGGAAISGGTVKATGGEAGSSYGIFADYGSDDIVTISGEDTDVTAKGGKATNDSSGIFAKPVLKISGGTVTAIGGEAKNEDYYTCSYGIHTYDTVAIFDSAVTATGGAASESRGICSYADVAISGGSVTATGDTAERNSCGIYASESVTIKSGTVTATGGAVTGEDAESCGIYAGNGDVTIEGGTVTATGGAVTGDDAESFGILSNRWDEDSEDMVDGTITISGGVVTATGGEATGEESESYGICAYGDMDISGGTVTATGGTAGEYSYGICSYYYETTISGGTVTATGGTATGEESDSYGILANTNIKISGGSVTATGDTATDESFGIFAYQTISISDTAEVTATGGKAASRSDGIYADGDVTITGGTVKATGDTANESFGIESYDSETIIISGGHVIAQTLAGESATTRTALNVKPDLSKYAGYRWRTSLYDAFTPSAYEYNAGHTYVEFYNGKTKTYTVTFDPNDGSGATKAVTVVSGSFTLPVCTFTAPSGKQFQGWATSATGEVISGTAITVTEDTTLYAVWEDIPATTYTVRFDANGGSGEMDAVTGVSGSYTLPTTTTFTAPSGKQFAGWATSANGEVITGTTITVTEDTTLYAVWAIPYGVTVNDVEVTDLNKDDVLGNGLVRYDPDTNTVYKAKGYLATLTVAGNGSTDVVLGGDTIAFLTVTGAKNVTGTDTDIVVEANITCTGDVTFNYEKNGLVNLIVTEAQNVTVISSYPNAPAILGYAKINCSGDVTISSANDIAVSRSLTVTAARDVTVTANTASGSSKPAIGGNADIICSGDVTISNTGGGKAVAGNLTYQNASGKHSYTVKTGDSLENLTDYATKEAGQTFGPATLDAAAVKISVPHTAGEWQSDSTQHWQVCTDCGIELERKDHTFSGSTCTVCGYTKSSGDGSSSSGGGSSAPTYPPTVTQPENGTVTVSPKAPKKGDTVTITPKPEAGYTVEQILVTDKDGDPVKVTNNGDGTYSFTQPAGKVNVEVTFMEDNSMLNFFVDVPANAYYYDAVLWAAEKGITGGVDDTHFAPNSPCTRAQIVTFLWRAAGSPEPENVSSFADVPADSYYAKAVAWAVENGITTGTGDGKFSPDATCTRAQAMAFIWRSQKSVAADGVNPFTDVAADAYYAGAVQWAVENGITNGSGDGTTFSPNANCTRAQIVTFLFRCLGEE